MSYHVVCADGKYRLYTDHATREAAIEDAGYFNGRQSGCLSWADPWVEWEHGCCPGGHSVAADIVFVYDD